MKERTCSCQLASSRHHDKPSSLAACLRTPSDCLLACLTWCYYCYYCAACCATSKQLLNRFAASQFDPHLHASPQLRSAIWNAVQQRLAGLVLGQLQSAEAWHKSVLAALLIRRVRPAQVRVRVRACVCSLHTSVRANAVDCLPLSVLLLRTALIFIYNLNAALPLSSI